MATDRIQAGSVSSTLIVPIVLSSQGVGGSSFLSEMALTNRGRSDAAVTFSYTPAFGSGGGMAADTLAAGRQRVVPDALAYLRSLNAEIVPESGDRGGTLRVTFSGLSAEGDAAVTVRTMSPSGNGQAGVAYRGIPTSSALTGTAYLCGLRQDGHDRSNVAVLNAGTLTDGNVTLRLTVISGAPASPGRHPLPDVTLAPGGFQQLSGILEAAGAADGSKVTNGYVQIERAAGTAPYYAYAVINDQVTSDGSFIPSATSVGFSGVARLVVPVIVETASYASELILTNFSETPRSLRFNYVAGGIAGGSAAFHLDVGPSEQRVIPDLVQYLRSVETAGIGPPGPDLVGTLFASVVSGDAAGLFLGARTSTRGSGRYGVFSGAVPFGGAAVDEAWLYGLQQTAESRTNLALVNTGLLSDGADTFRVELYDGETGEKTATVEGDATSLAAKGFTQIGSVLSTYAPGSSNAYARITRTSGSNPFVAYAVVNDGARPGERTGDGALVEMSVVGTDPFPQAFGVFAAFAPEFAPFWTSLGLDYPGYQAWVGARMRELGATWTRSNLQLIWDFVEPVKGGSFDWVASQGGEQVFAGAAAQGVQYLGVFHEGSGPEGSPGRPTLRNPLDDLPAYQRFVQAAVERYDGDGIDDAPGGIVIKHWQVGNETGGWPNSGRSNADYVRWFEAAEAAIRRADPESRVVLIASTDGSSLDSLHAEVIRTLAADGVRFDVVDLHHWKTATLASSRMEAVPAYRSLLSSVGAGGTELWSCEHGTYVGTPLEQPGECSPACSAGQVCSPHNTCVPRCTGDASCPSALPRCDTSTGLCTQITPDQTRADQARSLLYRYVVNRALGVKRILWNNLAGWRCFGGGCGSLYDRMGLVADGYGPGETMADVGEPRPAFHSYRMLAARTDGSVAESLGETATGDSALHVYLYRTRSSSKPGLVAWADSAKTAVLDFAAPRAEVTSLVTDDLGTPSRHEVLATSNGKLSVTLDPDPVWIAEPLE